VDNEKSIFVDNFISENFLQLTSRRHIIHLSSHSSQTIVALITVAAAVTVVFNIIVCSYVAVARNIAVPPHLAVVTYFAASSLFAIQPPQYRLEQ
jgi:hypothetical protein